MKKFLTFLMASFLLVVFALPVGAASRAEMSEASREKLDTFFSNFAEARVGSFVMNNEIPMDTFVDFGVQHNIINRKYDLVNVNEGYWGVKKEAVENAVYKYFGRRINAVSSRQYKLTNNLYLVPKASGEGLVFAQVGEWHENGTDIFTGVANIYSVSSGFTGNVHGTAEQWRREAPEDVPALIGRYMFTVTRSSADADRYVLVDWLGK